MKRLIILVLFLAAMSLSLPAQAQESVAFRYGLISYDEVLTSMPEYAQMETDLAALKEQYDAEMNASAEEFNAKYEAFLNDNAGYAPSILRKRQAELEDMLRRNEAFRDEATRLLAQAKEEMLAAARAKLDAAIEEIACEYSLAFVLNTDSDAVPYMNAKTAYDITAAAKSMVCK
ncbi:MAG: OmpH family outer membrane protein [Prevotella sp.]|nr:OmpH family outer membrane protein [Prevotella sp.]